MGMLADLFVAEERDALQYGALAVGKECPPDKFDRVESGHITNLEFETLWAIVEGRAWDCNAHALQDMQVNPGGESWLFRFPPAFVDKLVLLESTQIRSAANSWAKTEELNCAASDVEPLINDLVRLARRATAGNRGLYLWCAL